VWKKLCRTDGDCVSKITLSLGTHCVDGHCRQKSDCHSSGGGIRCAAVKPVALADKIEVKRNKSGLVEGFPLPPILPAYANYFLAKF
jgi:hypothetical protein